MCSKKILAHLQEFYMKKTKVIFVLLALMLAGSIATAKSNGKSSGRNNDDRPRPGMELTTLTGKLVYAGEEDKAASLQIAEGESLTLQLMKKPEGREGMKEKKDMPEKKDFQGKKDDKKGWKDKDSRNKKNEKGKSEKSFKNPPKPLTLEDLKKLDGKNVEVKGFKKRDGSLVVLEVSEQ